MRMNAVDVCFTDLHPIKSWIITVLLNAHKCWIHINRFIFIFSANYSKIIAHAWKWEYSSALIRLHLLFNECVCFVVVMRSKYICCIPFPRTLLYTGNVACVCMRPNRNCTSLSANDGCPTFAHSNDTCSRCIDRIATQRSGPGIVELVFC